MTPPLCEPRRRAGIFVQAQRSVAGEAFCANCFRGKPIRRDRAILDAEIPRPRVSLARTFEELFDEIELRVRAGAPPERQNQILTQKQEQVYGLLRAGLSNKAIAAKTGVSESAAKQMIGRIYRLVGREKPRRLYRVVQPLTEKQVQIYELLKAGFSDKAIAEKVGISVYAVQNKIARIYRLVGRHKSRRVYRFLVPPLKTLQLLTERQRRVYELMRMGLQNKEIADEIDISEECARAILSSIYHYRKCKGTTSVESAPVPHARARGRRRRRARAPERSDLPRRAAVSLF